MLILLHRRDTPSREPCSLSKPASSTAVHRTPRALSFRARPSPEQDLFLVSYVPIGERKLRYQEKFSWDSHSMPPNRLRFRNGAKFSCPDFPESKSWCFIPSILTNGLPNAVSRNRTASVTLPESGMNSSPEEKGSFTFLLKSSDVLCPCKDREEQEVDENVSCWPEFKIIRRLASHNNKALFLHTHPQKYQLKEMMKAYLERLFDFFCKNAIFINQKYFFYLRCNLKRGKRVVFFPYIVIASLSQLE